MEEKKKEEPLKGEIAKLINQRTYLWCAIIIISLFVINQFALMHCSNKVLADQFTFASTISSIILSVIAIIMSVVSSDSINSLLHKFRDLHDEIKDVPGTIDSSIAEMNKASGKFEEIYETLKNTPQKIEESAKVMGNISNDVNKSIEKLSELLIDIYHKTEKIDSIGENVNKLLEGRILKASAEIGENKSSNKISEEQALEIALSGSPLGTFLLYAVKLSKDKNKRLSFIEIASIFPDEDYSSYLYGYYIAIASTGIIVGTEVGAEAEKMFEIQSYNPGLNTLKDRLIVLLKKNNLSDYVEKIEIVEKIIEDSPSITSIK